MEKAPVFFITRHKNYVQLSDDVDANEGFRIMNEFLKERNFKSYYIRTTKIPEGVWIDFGSHTQFCLWGHPSEKRSVIWRKQDD